MSQSRDSLDGIRFSSTSSYKILQELGRGGMGVVYLAEKDCEGVIDHVVLKTLRQISDKQIERLKNEANVATILRHENIVKTYGLEAMPVGILPDAFREQMQQAGASAFDAAREQDSRPVYRPRLTPSTLPRPSGGPGYTAAETNAFDPRRASDSQTGRPDTEMTVTSYGSIPARDALPLDAPSVDPMTPGEATRMMREGDKLYCIAMDYVEGTDVGRIFREHLRAWLLPPPMLSAFIISRICRALAYAHQYIVHRDISPENILVNTHGVAKLTDFGIAVAAGKYKELAGKIMYMAPEQLKGEDVDQRSDIFALGLVAYQLLTGINLFIPPPGTTMEQAYAQVTHRMREMTIPPPHVVRDDVPEIVSSIVMQMLQKEPSERYADMEEVGSDLEKKYLYAEGFGPTNNSLAAYLRMFDSGFQLMEQADLRQLTFLKSPSNPGRLSLRRLYSYDAYTRVGKNVLKETQRGTLPWKILENQAAEQKAR